MWFTSGHRIAGPIQRFLRLLMTMLLVAMPRAHGQQVWLGVRGPDVRPKGAADWNALFKPTAEWSAVASKIQIFSITAGYVVQASDQELKAVAADLTNRHIAIALGMQSVGIGPGDHCGHEEGYGVPGFTARAAEKLHRLEIPLQYLALDEPLWFGHYDSGSQGCRFDLPELARRVALNVRAYQQYFPDVTVGDIEPVPILTTFADWKSAFRSFAHELSSATGRSLAFLQTDVDWRLPSFHQSIIDTATFAHQQGLKFGVIYKGDGGDDSGPAWVADAINHFDGLETTQGVMPEQAIVETWDPHPTHVLPETSDATLSHVIARYRLIRTKLVAVRDGAAVSGQLTDQGGSPVPDAKVELQAIGRGRGRVPLVHSVSGTVPAAARFAIIGIRVNSECLCAGPNNLLIGDIRYSESAGGTVVQQYNLPEKVGRRSGGVWNGIEMATTAIGGQSFAHLVVGPDQHFAANGPMFSVTPGARFNLEVPISAASGDGMFGAPMVIWLDNPRHGLMRTRIYLGRQLTVASSAKTGRDGRFKVVAAGDIADSQGGLQITFAGDPSRRSTLLLLH
ncbi:hypothetical protein [Rhodopila sp.]|uniref:hypothetical protein n=1 Tax=Rhodopila sp. TaxID=2480087 RepID=UPI003D107586